MLTKFIACSNNFRLLDLRRPPCQFDILLISDEEPVLRGTRKIGKFLDRLFNDCEPPLKFFVCYDEGRSDANDTGTAGFELETPVSQTYATEPNERVCTHQKTLCFH